MGGWLANCQWEATELASNRKLFTGIAVSGKLASNKWLAMIISGQQQRTQPCLTADCPSGTFSGIFLKNQICFSTGRCGVHV